MSNQKGFLMNMQTCYGCQTCEIACKSENNLARGVRWRRVRKLEIENPSSISTLSMSCNHCEKPECMRVCPAKAYSKRPDGVVVQDHARCLGCRMCIIACPYSAPSYDEKEGKVSKCNYCASRIDKGLKPRCVEACPGNAMEAGDLEALRKQGNAQTIAGAPTPHISNPSIVIIPTKAVK
ncbi:Anaerobic dimethyl sulfoxide reductase chain B [Sporomusa rhizae]|uniref:4Fe-4S dicluster domain-containing protein n=1 Tax=Sporomusa rhizae TaxID=357999 RepID=UPI00352AB456